MSEDLFFDSVAGNEYELGVRDHLVAEDVWLAGKATQVLDIAFDLVNLDVLTPGKRIHMPVGADAVVLTHCVLNQVNFQLHFGRVTLRNEYCFAELAKDVALVALADCGVVDFFLVKFEVEMGIGGHEFRCHFASI